MRGDSLPCKSEKGSGSNYQSMASKMSHYLFGRVDAQKGMYVSEAVSLDNTFTNRMHPQFSTKKEETLATFVKECILAVFGIILSFSPKLLRSGSLALSSPICIRICICFLLLNHSYPVNNDARDRSIRVKSSHTFQSLATFSHTETEFKVVIGGK